MKIYLDSCALSRPYDRYLNEEIIQEAKSVEAIFELVDSGELSLVDSEILDIEIESISDEEKRSRINSIRSKAKYYVTISREVKKRAKEFLEYGIKPMDALQLASAEKGANMFITVDKRLLKKANMIDNLGIEVLNPIEFWRYYGSKRNQR